MKTLTKDARGFIEGVTQYIRREKKGTSLLPKVQSLFTRVTAAAKKERVANIASAVALTNEEKDQVSTALFKLLGHEVECHYNVEPSLLGGMKIQVADWIVDSSLQSQLTGMSRSIQTL